MKIFALYFLYICCLSSIILGCYEKTQTGDISSTQEESALKDSALKNAKKKRAVYQPPPGYAPASSDPLAALYGVSQGEGIGKGTGKGTKDHVKARFESLPHYPLKSPVPQSWRRIIRKINSNKTTQVKISEWSYTQRARMISKRKDRALSFTLHLWGSSSEIQSLIYEVFSEKEKLIPQFPRKWGTEHEHIVEIKPIKWRIKKKLRRGVGDFVHMVYELDWDQTWPDSKLPLEEQKNCRYIPALVAPRGPNEWAIKRFKSNGKRRFAEWTYSIDKQGAFWSAMWIYRNGDLRDKGVGWWSNQLSRRGGERSSIEGMAQEWRLPSGEKVSWWSETDPGPMGCHLRGPLLGVSWFTPHS